MRPHVPSDIGVLIWSGWPLVKSKVGKNQVSEGHALVGICLLEHCARCLELLSAGGEEVGVVCAVLGVDQLTK